jgi:hypothetical protein
MEASEEDEPKKSVYTVCHEYRQKLWEAHRLTRPTEAQKQFDDLRNWVSKPMVFNTNPEPPTPEKIREVLLSAAYEQQEEEKERRESIRFQRRLRDQRKKQEKRYRQCAEEMQKRIKEEKKKERQRQLDEQMQKESQQEEKQVSDEDKTFVILTCCGKLEDISSGLKSVYTDVVDMHRKDAFVYEVLARCSDSELEELRKYSFVDSVEPPVDGRPLDGNYFTSMQKTSDLYYYYCC